MNQKPLPKGKKVNWINERCKFENQKNCLEATQPDNKIN